MRKYFAVGLILLAACSSAKKRNFEGRIGVQKAGPGEYMFVETSGNKVGYSALELEEIARAYVKEKKVPFELDGASRNIWIQTDGSPIIAKVYFGSGPGHLLQIDIGRDGKVIRHTIYPKNGS